MCTIARSARGFSRPRADCFSLTAGSRYGPGRSSPKTFARTCIPGSRTMVGGPDRSKFWLRRAYNSGSNYKVVLELEHADRSWHESQESNWSAWEYHKSSVSGELLTSYSCNLVRIKLMSNASTRHLRGFRGAGVFAVPDPTQANFTAYKKVVVDE